MKKKTKKRKSSLSQNKIKTRKKQNNKNNSMHNRVGGKWHKSIQFWSLFSTIILGFSSSGSERALALTVFFPSFQCLLSNRYEQCQTDTVTPRCPTRLQANSDQKWPEKRFRPTREAHCICALIWPYVTLSFYLGCSTYPTPALCCCCCCGISVQGASLDVLACSRPNKLKVLSSSSSCLITIGGM
jgi:hypothetical protein